MRHCRCLRCRTTAYWEPRTLVASYQARRWPSSSPRCRQGTRQGVIPGARRGRSETRVTSKPGVAVPLPTARGSCQAPCEASPATRLGKRLAYLRLHQPARLRAQGRRARGAERRVHRDAVLGAVQGGEALGALGTLTDPHVGSGRRPRGRGPGVEEAVALAEAGLLPAHQPAFQQPGQGEEAAQRQAALGAHGASAGRAGGARGRTASQPGSRKPGAARVGRAGPAGVGGPGGGGGPASRSRAPLAPASRKTPAPARLWLGARVRGC